jgi:hypothetical protein
MKISEATNTNKMVNRQCLTWNEKSFKAGGVGISKKPVGQKKNSLDNSPMPTKALFPSGLFQNLRPVLSSP